jgi:uncharacterized protein YjbJ (UPF0337 family)
MSTEDKAANKADEFQGKAKEFIGDKTGNRDLEAEGQADQMGSHVKQAGEHIKDVAKDMKSAVDR